MKVLLTKDVKGKGKAGEIVRTCLENHVLALTAGGNKVRLLPALNIPMELLEKAASVIVNAFNEAGEKA